MKFVLIAVATGLLSVSAPAQAVAKHSVDVRHEDSVAVPFKISKAGHVKVEVEAWAAKYSDDNPMNVRLKLVSTGYAYTRAETRTFVPCNGTGKSAASNEPNAMCADFGATITKQDVKLGRKWSLVVTNMGESDDANVHANVRITQSGSAR